MFQITEFTYVSMLQQRSWEDITYLYDSEYFIRQNRSVLRIYVGKNCEEWDSKFTLQL